MMIEHDTNTTRNTTSTVRSSDGTTISYLSVGSGPTVIVVPGALSLANDYTAFARALAEHFTVHTIERRGRGQSGPQGNDYSIVKECEDVLALQRKTGASLLVGHSFGGLVALEAARDNRAFASVAVYEPGVSIDGSIAADWISGYEKKLAENKKLDAFVAFVLAMGPQSARRIPPWLMKRMLPLFMKSHELKTTLSLLQEASVLLMHGGKGHTPQADTSMKRLAAVFQCTETREFPALDHFGLDKTGFQEVARAVSEYFLKE